MTWSNLEFQVRNSTGTPVTGPKLITTTDGTGSCQVALFTFSTSLWSSPRSGSCSVGQLGGGAPIASGSEVRMESSANLSNLGYGLVLIGQGSFSGSLLVSIP